MYDVGIYRNKKHDEQMQIVVKMMAHASNPLNLSNILITLWHMRT